MTSFPSKKFSGVECVEQSVLIDWWETHRNVEEVQRCELHFFPDFLHTGLGFVETYRDEVVDARFLEMIDKVTHLKSNQTLVVDSDYKKYFAGYFLFGARLMEVYLDHHKDYQNNMIWEDWGYQHNSWSRFKGTAAENQICAAFQYLLNHNGRTIIWTDKDNPILHKLMLHTATVNEQDVLTGAPMLDLDDVATIAAMLY